MRCNISISIGDALLKLGVDTKDLDRGLQGIKGTIQKHSRAIGMAMTAAGGAILAAGALSVKAFAEMGDEVQKMALRTGFSTEALSELRHAADLSGASLAGLEKASRTLSGAILDAGYGLETYVRAFDQIGLSYEDLSRLSPEDQFTAVMEALAGVEDESRRAALATDLFGRAGTQLLPMLVNGTEGLAEMRQEAHDLGIVFDQEAANKAAEFNDAMTRLKESVSGVKMVIAEQLIPILMPMIDKTKEIISGISAWMREHPKLTDVIVKFAGVMAGLMVVGGPMLIFAPTIKAGIIVMRDMARLITTKLIPALWSFKIAILEVIAIIAGLATVAYGLWLLWRVKIKGEVLDPNPWEQLKNDIRGFGGALTSLANEIIPSVITASGEEVEALNEATDAVNNQSEAFQVLKNQIEGAFAAARREIAPPVREPFVSAEHRARYEAEANLWESKARIAASAGNLEEAAFAAQQAAAMHTRLQQFEFGGIAMRPMVASIAEKQPEAVIPLDKIGGMVGGKNVNIYVELDGRTIARAVGQPLVDEIRLRTGVRI